MNIEPESPEIAQYVSVMMDMHKALNEDSCEALELFRFVTHEFCTRTMVRTLAAEFEAKIYFLGEFLLKLNSPVSKHFPLSHEEVYILKSETLTIKNNGDFRSSKKYYPFIERMLFVLKIAARNINPAAMPNTNDKNWESVKTFISIRNRLTHPKQLSDLHVSDDEVDHLNNAQDWIRGSLSALFTAGSDGEKLQNYIAKYKTTNSNK